jgi:predicted naringenin-chalcone synthase
MKSVLPVLTQFEIIRPKNLLDQASALEWSAAAHFEADRRAGKQTDALAILFKRFGVKPTLIGSRGFDTPDPTHQNWPEMQIYGGTDSPSGQDIETRTRFFLERSREVMHEFYRGATAPSHLIHVTCTGYASPSAAQTIVSEKGWDRSTDVTHAYHMGCYASMPAVRMANAFSQARPHESRDSRIDIVHNELCSLHMNPADHVPEQIVVQSLFADGHIKYSVVPENLAKNGFKILRVCEQIIPGTAKDMSWIPSAWGMKMTLSRDVPDHIREALRPFLNRLADGTGYSAEFLLDRAIFAVHPGGPKIIQSVEELLALRPDQIAASKKILFERGNMSSATLPHIWESISREEHNPGTPIVSLAFGPGLTIFGSLFEVL